MRGQIANRLVAALLAVAAVPLVGVGVYTIHSHTQALRQLALSAARERAQLKVRKVEEMLGDVRGDLFFLARSPMLFSLVDELGRDSIQADFWRQKLGQQFLAFTHNKPIYTALRYIDEEGREVVRAEHDGLRSWLIPDARLGSRVRREYFRSALVLPAGEVYVAAVDREDGEAREPVLRYALRVIDRRDQRRGVLVADLFARHVVAAVREGEGETWLLDGEGRLLSPPGEAGRPPPEGDLARIQERLRAGEGAVLAEEGEATVSWAALWPARPQSAPLWLLVERVPEAAVFASLHRFRLVFATLVAGVVGTALLLSLLLARRMALPLAALRDGARRLAGGDLAYRLRVDTGDEIQEVAEEFNRMGGALQETYRRLEERDAVKSEQLENVTRQLVESEKLAAVGRLAAGVAHEINNPIGVVSLFVQRLLERGGLSADQEEKLRVVERQTDRVERITRGLLDFARARQYRRQRFDVVGAVRAALQVMGPHLETACIQVELCAREAGVEIAGDAEQIQQVFENLVLNAVQAMEGGGKLQVEVSREGGEVLVRVADTGPGIPTEHLERVFEPFFTTKEVGQGTGLGLAIGYGVVKAHGGRMWAENRTRGGALLVVALPRAKEEENA